MDGLFKIEAENFQTIDSRYEFETIAATGDTVLSLVSLRPQDTSPNLTASASTPFTFEESGKYDILLAYFDEEDGAGTYEIKVGGRTVSEFQTLTSLTTPAVSGNIANADNRKEETVALGIDIYAQDEIEVTFTTDQGESRSFDFIQFERVGDALGRELGEPLPPISRTEDKTVLDNEDNIFRGTGKSETIRARKGDDRINALGGDDRVFGGQGRDTISGRGGRDYLSGEEGRDVLVGGGKSDIIIGGEGNDILRGNTGRDTFVYNSFDDGRDTIDDFNVNKDFLDLRELLSGVEYTARSAFDKFADFVDIKQAGSRTKVRIDSDGVVGDGKFTTIALLKGVDADTLGPDRFLIDP